MDLKELTDQPVFSNKADVIIHGVKIKAFKINTLN